MDGKEARAESGPGEGTGSVARLEVTLPSSLDAPAAARRALNSLEGRVDHTSLAKARLALTELVANGVKHSDGEAIDVRVRADERLVRAEVLDGGEGFSPPQQEGNLLRTHGWGLVIVRRVADRWGIGHGDGLVWFEIDAQAK